MKLALVAALGATVLLWAASFPAITAGLADYSPSHLVLLRFLVASTVFIAYAAMRPARRLRLPERRDLGGIGLLAVVGIVVYHLVLVEGQLTVTAGAAGTLSNTSPVFTALWGTLFLRDRLNPAGWAGIAIAFAGAILIGLGEGRDFRFELGAGLVLLAALSWSVYFTAQKPYLARYTPVELMTYVVVAGTVFLLVFLPGLPDAVGAAGMEATLAVVFLGVFPTAVAYVTWAYVLSRMPVSFAVGFLYLVPVFAFAIAWLWLGQVPTAVTLLGGTVALAGVILLTLRGK